MATPGRNERCPCGSGRKLKRCCGEERGPSAVELAKAHMAIENRKAVLALLKVSRAEFDELFREMLDLPARHISMQAPLPRLLSPELEALRSAIDHDDGEELDAALPAAVAQLDGPVRRVQLAQAVASLRDAGRVDTRVAAVAVVDLSAERSWLLEASLAQALAVSVGAARTPSGLVLVGR